MNRRYTAHTYRVQPAANGIPVVLLDTLSTGHVRLTVPGVVCEVPRAYAAQLIRELRKAGALTLRRQDPGR